MLSTVDRSVKDEQEEGTVVGDASSAMPVGQRHPRLVEVVTEELRRLIVAGRWHQGERLIESHVASELGVSRNPVREALRSLEADGFVELEPRKGARVAVLSADEAADLFDVRGALEELAAGLAARRCSPAALSRLREVVAAGQAATAATRLEEVPALNTAFHVALCEAADNAQLTAVMGPLRDRIQWVYSARVHERAPASWAEHAEIVEAVAARDEAAARVLAGQHIGRAKAAFIAAQKPRTAPPSTRTTEPVT